MRCEFEHFNEPRSRHTDNDAVHWHVLAGYLQPTTRSSTKINTTSCTLEKGELLVQLNELERRTGSVPLLSAQVIRNQTLKDGHIRLTLRACSTCQDDPFLSFSASFPLCRVEGGDGG